MERHKALGVLAAVALTIGATFWGVALLLAPVAIIKLCALYLMA